MESTTKNRKTRQQIAEMVQQAFHNLTLADDENAVVELVDGWFNVAYDIRLSDGRQTILKIAPPPGSEIMTYEQNIMLTEVHMMQLVANNQLIPVPEIYYFDTSHTVCDSDYFFMEKLQGENYAHIQANLSADPLTKIEQQIGNIIREINTFTGTYFGYEGNPDLRAESWKDTFLKIIESVLSDGVNKNADFGYEIEEIRHTINKHASSLEAVTVPQLVHWDAWTPNFFIKDENVLGIIDFERALWGDPLMEGQFRALAWAGITDSMRGYGKTTFTQDEKVRCHLYALHLALVMIVEAYYRHYETDEVRDSALWIMNSAMEWLKNN